MKQKNFLFLMDPLETVKMTKDTSFILMIGAHERGHKTFYLSNDGITRENGQNYFHTLEVIPQKNEDRPFKMLKHQTLSEDDVDVIFIRTDPPFDSAYTMNTWLLDLLPKRIVVINDPTGIRNVNEKIWATQFSDLVPPTLITQHISDYESFLAEHEKIVLKPTDGFGGQGVFIVELGDTNENVIFESLSQNSQKKVIAQKFIPESKIGDKRILLLNGEPLGAVLRVHGDRDHRNNFFAGGHPEKTDITKRDKDIIAELKPHLQKLGLYFVGIDIMGDYLIEVNVTSPTVLQEMNFLYNQTLEDDVIRFCEKLIDQAN